MTHLLAEGGYQIFIFSNSERIWLSLAIVAALASIGTGLLLMRNVLAADQGTASMKEIAKAVQEGAEAFLARQFRTILIIIVPLAVLIFFTATKVTHTVHRLVLVNTPLGHLMVSLPVTVTDLTFVQAGMLPGALLPRRCAVLGSDRVRRHEPGRTRQRAHCGRRPRAGSYRPPCGWPSARGPSPACSAWASVFSAPPSSCFVFQNTATSVLVGFGFGASLLALFMRVGGGIFTKAADVGADLVGKVEAGIPEDDPRNAATIADNVGDNVGDCAGMAADLFESYVITIIASIILGVTAFASIGRGADAAKTVVFPIAIPAIGIIATIVGIFVVRAYPRDKNAMAPINRGVWTAAAITIAGSAVVAGAYLHYWKAFYAVLVGVALTVVASLITEHFTSTERSPVREVAESARTGPATLTLAGISLGLESSVWAIIAIVLAISVSIGLAGGNIELSLYLVSLTGIGLLSTAGMIVSEDSFGPVSDNAAGVAEMSGEFTGEAERVMVSLDAVGNTTKAVTKGVAIGSAVIAAVALFASFIETIGTQLNLHAPVGAGVNWLFNAAADLDQRLAPDDVHRRAHRRLDRLHLLGPGHPGGGPLGRHRRPRGAPPVPRAPGDHGLHGEARVREGHLHLHDGGPAGAGHPRPPGRTLARSSWASASTTSPSAPSWSGPSSPASSWPSSCPTPVGRGTTPRSTSRTATKGARAPTPTRPRSSATPSATRSRTRPVPPSTR